MRIVRRRVGEVCSGRISREVGMCGGKHDGGRCKQETWGCVDRVVCMAKILSLGRFSRSLCPDYWVLRSQSRATIQDRMFLSICVTSRFIHSVLSLQACSVHEYLRLNTFDSLRYEDKLNRETSTGYHKHHENFLHKHNKPQFPNSLFKITLPLSFTAADTPGTPDAAHMAAQPDTASASSQNPADYTYTFAHPRFHSPSASSHHALRGSPP